MLNQDDKIMKILGVHTINRIICNTDKGLLTLQIRKGDNNYHLVLDSVPLGEEANKEIMDILYPAKEKEIPQVNKANVLNETKEKVVETGPETVKISPKVIAKKKVIKNK